MLCEDVCEKISEVGWLYGANQRYYNIILSFDEGAPIL